MTNNEIRSILSSIAEVYNNRQKTEAMGLICGLLNRPDVPVEFLAAGYGQIVGRGIPANVPPGFTLYLSVGEKEYGAKFGAAVLLLHVVSMPRGHWNPQIFITTPGSEFESDLAESIESMREKTACQFIFTDDESAHGRVDKIPRTANTEEFVELMQKLMGEGGETGEGGSGDGNGEKEGGN